ncbi:MAG TPA: glycerate kinase [Candidatus Dormibacteraeota bacterium]|nr:glycerate kinase [Candidatus Dormibacteraeota bacterium]
MRIVVAPNSFKGSLSATQAASAIVRGVRQVMPDADVVEVPVADGGDGTVDALVGAHHGTYGRADVEGPLGDPVHAVYGLIDGGRTAVVELASASGFELIAAARRDPRQTSTYGFGQLLDATRKAGVEKVIAGIGGSATNDGGAGMAQALGYRLIDATGHDLARGGAALTRLERIEGSGVDSGWHPIRVLVACDVTNPLTGPLGASRVYGPQKGADEAAVEMLDQALERLASVIEHDLGKKVRDLPGAGAAGGTGAGLVAFLGAELVRGAPLIVEAAGLDRALPGSDLVITGEGRIDGQTAFGKAPGEVARRAQAAGVPVLFLAGTRGAGWDELGALGINAVYTLDRERAQEGGPDRQNLAELMQDADQALTAMTARAIRERGW